MDPRIEVSIWERIGAIDPKSAYSRERFSQFLIEQRARRHGTTPREAVVERLTKAETYSDLYNQDRTYATTGGLEIVVVITPDGMSAIGPEGLELLQLWAASELDEEAA